MNIFVAAYNTILFEPLYNLLVGITNVLPSHNVGISILIVTFIVRLILLPSALHQAKQMHGNQVKMKGVKDQIKKIQDEHKDDKAKKAEATMAVYKEAGINPASGCLPLLIQLPILIAMYRVFLVGMGAETFDHLYSYVGKPEVVNTVFLGIDLNSSSFQLAILAGIFQFILMRMTTAMAPAQTPGSNDQSAEMMASMQKNMAYMFPVMTVFISLQLPAALALYWVASTIFGIAQQYYFKKQLKIVNPAPI